MDRILILINFITLEEAKSTEVIQKAIELSETSEVSLVTFFIDKEFKFLIEKNNNISLYDLSCFPQSFEADTVIVYSNTIYRMVKQFGLKFDNLRVLDTFSDENEMCLKAENLYLSHFKRQQTGLLKNKNREIEQLKNDLLIAEDKYNAISNAFFWRISAPLRSLIIKLKGLDKESDASPNISNEVNKTINWFNENSEIIILADKKDNLYSSLIRRSLEKIGINVCVLSQYVKANKDILHFVINPKQFNNYPDKYILVQTNDANEMKWDESANIVFKNAIGILDSSLYDIQFLKIHTDFQNNIYYVPFAFDENIRRDCDNYECDVLVCMNETISRHQSIFMKLSKCFDVKKYDYTSSDTIPSAKVTIVLNELEDSGLNSELMYKLLSFDNTYVVSEITYDLKQHNLLKSNMDFIQYNNENEIIDKIKNSLDDKMMRDIENLYDTSFLTFEYFFYRFLLANNWMSFDEFYQRTNKAIHFSGNRICLSLPEDADRRETFDLDNAYGFEMFPALRHIKGWIGCGMSYKYIMKKALDQNISQLIVCEDDTYFPNDFETRFAHCLKYLENNKSWDIFQGIIADVGDVRTKNVEKAYGETFITIDHMMSMVFNIYSKDIYAKIIQWDETNYDLETNTIDRALEGYDLNVVTTSPFLVGHKEDLHSTIWGFNNAQYHDWIEKSNKKIELLIQNFEKNKEI